LQRKKTRLRTAAMLRAIMGMSVGVRAARVYFWRRCTLLASLDDSHVVV